MGLVGSFGCRMRAQNFIVMRSFEFLSIYSLFASYPIRPSHATGPLRTILDYLPYLDRVHKEWPILMSFKPEQHVS